MRFKMPLVLLAAGAGCVSPSEYYFGKRENSAAEYRKYRESGGMDEEKFDGFERDILEYNKRSFDEVFKQIPPSRRDSQYENMIVSESEGLFVYNFELRELSRQAKREGREAPDIEQELERLVSDWSMIWGRFNGLIELYSMGKFSYDLISSHSPKHDFQINSEPSGATVEILDRLKVLDPRTGERILTADVDWIVLGQTPYTLKDYVDEGDGLISIRLTKSGNERILNVPLDSKEIKIDMEDRE